MPEEEPLSQDSRDKRKKDKARRNPLYLSTHWLNISSGAVVLALFLSLANG